jgi:cell division septation protein DedD
MESQDTEITLGTGRMLGFFFGLAILCAVFFGMGFTLGRNTAVRTPTVEPAATTTAVTSPGLKPAAAKTGAAPAACADGQNCDKSGSDELSFIKSDQKAAPVAEATPAETTQEPAPPPVAATTTAAAKPAPEMKNLPSNGAFVVQIAAVTKKDDAEALVGALRKKNYPVFISADANDHLYHVQVGPYTDRKDATTVKDKLSGDGYNAIVK